MYLSTNQLKECIDENTVIACIGTDKHIGDCLGPLVGDILTKNNFKYPVYGTLNTPIHALNIDTRLELIMSKHPNAKIIAVDACLGPEDDIGLIRIRETPLSPGKGVDKILPSVGEKSIVGIVDSSKNSIIFGSRTIRLSFVMDMAEQIAEMLMEITK